ncbi:MAG: sugar ABC transporter substrate-binding protein, partial [Bacteroidetes bacterium]
MIPKATESAFWKNVERGARKMADSLRIELLWAGPETESKPEKQIELVQDLISNGAGAICLAP